MLIHAPLKSQSLSSRLRFQAIQHFSDRDALRCTPPPQKALPPFKFQPSDASIWRRRWGCELWQSSRVNPKALLHIHQALLCADLRLPLALSRCKPSRRAGAVEEGEKAWHCGQLGVFEVRRWDQKRSAIISTVRPGLLFLTLTERID